jgi:hypothetical protein
MEILKILTAKQSLRNQILMFLWRILLAILLTNHVLKRYDYEFQNTEIGLNDAIGFVLSPVFLLITIIYLLLIFLFFWVLKFIGVVIMLIARKSQFTKKETYNYLEKFNIVKKSNEAESFELNGIASLKDIDDYIKDLEVKGNSKLLGRLADYFNVAFATIFTYIFLSKDIPHIFGFLFGCFLGCITLFFTLLLFKTICVISKTENIDDIRDQLAEDYFKKFPDEILSYKITIQT